MGQKKKQERIKHVIQNVQDGYMRKAAEDNDCSIVVMQHAWRINGHVDVFKGFKTVFDKKQNKYLQNFANKYEAVDKAIELALKYGESEPFKKTKKGNMSYQEFHHSPDMEDRFYSARYHWDNDNEKSDTHLYFIRLGDFVKIGKSKDPKKRMKTFQTGMPIDPKLIYTATHKGHLEGIMHRCFNELMSKNNGEWFYYHPAIKSFIVYIKNNQK